MSDSQLQRDAVVEVARDTAAAAPRARAIEDAAQRAEALGWVVRYAPDGELVDLAREAVDAAGSCETPQQQVAAACFALRALVERGARDAALELLEIVLHALPRIATAAARAEALRGLAEAVADSDAGVQRSLLFALAEVFDGSRHWRVERAFAAALQAAAAAQPEFVAKLVAGADDARRPALEAALAGDPAPARIFFC